MGRFDVGSLLQGQMRIAKIKSAYNSLFLVFFLQVGVTLPTSRTSWAKNRLMWSDFTFGSSFKVKRMVDWLWCVIFLVDTICIGSPMC